MAEQTYADDEDLDRDDPAGLRRQIKALSKEKAALTEELTSLRTGLREKTVAEVLTAKGVNPKVSRFIPSDVEGEEAIGKWLEENADLFGATPAAAAPEPTQTPDQIADAQRLQALSAAAKAPASGLADFEARLAAATSEKELNEIWQQGQGTFL